MNEQTRALLAKPSVKSRGVYLAGPSGFFEAGRLWHDTVLVPTVVAAGFIPLDPWADQSAIEPIIRTYEFGPRRRDLLRSANLEQGRLDLLMVDRCAAVLASLDGPQVDDGTAVEIGFAHHAGKLIVGLRTDMRKASDNEGSDVNLMIETCVLDSGGIMTSSLDEAVACLRQKLFGQDV